MDYKNIIVHSPRSEISFFGYHLFIVVRITQPLQGDVVHFQNDLCVILDQGQDGFAWSLSPLVTAVKRILTFFSMGETVITAHQVIGRFVMRRWAIPDDIHISALKHGLGSFHEKTMKLGPRARF